jgi:AraC-like DNA-binding protein
MLHFSLIYDSKDGRKAQAYEQLRENMEAIFWQHCEDPVGNQLQQHVWLFDSVDILVKHFSTPLAIEETQLIRSDRNRLEPVLEYIQLHHDEELPLDWAAELMGLNKEYFCRLFKKNMGISYLKYLNQIRATAVCTELELSDDPIGEIAARHGFSDMKMMNQYFRDLYDCTPSEKRKVFREMKVEI